MLRGIIGPVGGACLALILGIGLGAWGMRIYFDRTLRRWDPGQRLVEELDAELGLNAEQRERVAVILADQKARMEERRRGWERDVHVLGRDGEDAIARLLDPRQSERFNALHDPIHGSVERYLWASQGGGRAIAAVGP